MAITGRMVAMNHAAIAGGLCSMNCGMFAKP